MPSELSATVFKAAVIEAAKPVLVGFHTDRCGMCHMQAPMLEMITSRLRSTASVFTVDSDRNPELLALFDVRSLPTMLLFTEGRIVRRFTDQVAGRELVAALLAILDES